MKLTLLLCILMVLATVGTVITMETKIHTVHNAAISDKVAKEKEKMIAHQREKFVYLKQQCVEFADNMVTNYKTTKVVTRHNSENLTRIAYTYCLEMSFD